MMEKELVFYMNPMSRARIARWMLEEIGQPYIVKPLEYGTTMKADDYLGINPMGKVPAIHHGDTVITETAAICAYLADVFPDAGLAPPIEQRADYYRWLFFTAGPLEYAVSNRAMGFEVTDDKKAMMGYGCYEDVMKVLESAVSNTSYITGENFSAADVYLGSQISWGLQFGTIEKKPVFERYCAHVTDRDAYRRASALDDALINAAK